MSEFLDIVQNFQVAIKALLMYTGSHPRGQASLASLGRLLDEWLETKPSIHIATSQGKIFLDGAAFEAKSIHLTALARQFGDRQISGVIFHRGVTRGELQEVLGILILKPAKIDEAGGVPAILARKNLPHVELSQIQYKEVREGEGGNDDHGGGSAPGKGVDDGVDEAAIAAMEALAASLAAAAAAAPKAAPYRGGSGTPGQGGSGTPGQGGPGTPGQGGSGTLGQGGVAVAGPQTPLFDLEILTDQWEEQLELIPHQSLLEGSFQAADLNYLGGTESGQGMGDGFPPAHQVEGLRRALLGLKPETLLSVVAGLDTLPPGQSGLRMGFQALAAEAFGQASAGLMQAEVPWTPTRDAIFSAVRFAPQRQSMMAALEAELRGRGAATEQMARLQELIQQMDWEGQSMEEKMRLAQEHGQLWALSLDQRLRFLRRLLDEGRVEGLLGLLDQILEALRQEDVARREMAVQTLTGVIRWMVDPGLPMEAEGPIIMGLTAHFGWEPLAHLHRATTEALNVVVSSQVNRDEPGQALALLQELSGLCAFQDNRQEWREAALASLWACLADPASLRKVVALLHTANAETMLRELVPYLEAVGAPAARLLVEILGDEPDRKRRGRLLEAIRCLGDAALPAVYEGLDSPAWFLVRNTLNLLADMGDASAVEPARQCLSHPDGRVKRAAVRALWKLGGPASVAPLLAAFPVVEPETQLEIMFALGQVRAVQAISALAAFAQDHRNPERLRVRAAETIGQIGDPRSVPVLAELARRKGKFFTSAEPIEVRLAACRALLVLDSPFATDTLCQLVAAEPWHKDRTVLQQIVNDRRPT